MLTKRFSCITRFDSLDFRNILGTNSYSTTNSVLGITINDTTANCQAERILYLEKGNTLEIVFDARMVSGTGEVVVYDRTASTPSIWMQQTFTNTEWDTFTMRQTVPNNGEYEVLYRFYTAANGDKVEFRNIEMNVYGGHLHSPRIRTGKILGTQADASTPATWKIDDTHVNFGIESITVNTTHLAISYAPFEGAGAKFPIIQITGLVDQKANTDIGFIYTGGDYNGETVRVYLKDFSGNNIDPSYFLPSTSTALDVTTAFSLSVTFI